MEKVAGGHFHSLPVKRQCTPVEVALLIQQYQLDKDEEPHVRITAAGKKKKNDKQPESAKEREALQRIRTELEAFAADGSRIQHDFSPSLSSSQRAILHDWAEELGLEHSSSGFGKHRHIMVKKPFAPDTHITAQGEIEELLYYNGYVGLSGPLVGVVGRHMAAGPASPGVSKK